MTISLNQLITNLQADVDAVDSSASMSSILTLMHKARKLTGISNYYDSAGQLPIDVKYDGMLAFSKADNTVYKFVDSGENSGTVGGWHQADSASYTVPPPTPVFMGGSSYGFNLGHNSNPYGYNSVIGRFPFASDGNASSWGSLANVSPHPTYKGHSFGVSKSETHSYQAGGNRGYPPANISTIRKFAFATPSSSSTVTSTLSTSRSYGNLNPFIPTDKDKMFFFYGLDLEIMPTASDTATLDVVSNYQASPTTPGAPGAGGAPNGHFAYIHHGAGWPQKNDNIHLFSFASGTTTSTISPYVLYGGPAGATAGEYGLSTYSGSETHMYVAGGLNYSIANSTAAYDDTIQKFGFSNDGNATDVGNLTGKMYGSSACSSTSAGYNMGGIGHPTHPVGSSAQNVIQKYSYTSDGNSTDVGDLQYVNNYASRGTEV